MIFTDKETTGLMKPDATKLNLQPYITEIYAIKLTDELEFIEEFDSLIKPPVPIPDEIIKLTGISNEMVASAPSFIGVYDDLVNLYLGERTVVGHNIQFDLGMLWAELARVNKQYHFPWPPEHICTIEKSMPLENRRLSLKNLHFKLFGEYHQDAHRAKSDVLATIRCFQELRNMGLI